MSPKKSRGRILAAVVAETRRRERMTVLVRKLDPAILAAAHKCFESDAAAASWLLSPLRAFGDREPAVLARTKSGREKVLHVLKAIEEGVFL